MLMTVSERGAWPRAGLFSLVQASKRDNQGRQYDPEGKVDFGRTVSLRQLGL